MTWLALAYSSTATQPMSAVEIGQLLLKARMFNASVGVSGVLLHDSRQFLQYLEGPPDAVERVWQRVSASPRHQQLTVLMREPTETRLFADWQMGCLEAPASLLQRLANEQWRIAMAVAERRQPLSPALALLRQFAQGVQREALGKNSGSPLIL
ncbi:BLUF domain-containing protein [Ideonella sp. 4Y11]|uniref:BLUF domain-containing protein n=1 Tax=Ideonella aquatica TaxID=2824119 RepID=A0A940YKZ0_9BURK|nr:BLUF domain-containing protein [Ideonella aquatica]MBQ0958927.1 BLUF domain-containing protein [Ideonella aquatica]